MYLRHQWEFPCKLTSQVDADDDMSFSQSNPCFVQVRASVEKNDDARFGSLACETNDYISDHKWEVLFAICLWAYYRWSTWRQHSPTPVPQPTLTSTVHTRIQLLHPVVMYKWTLTIVMLCFANGPMLSSLFTKEGVASVPWSTGMVT